MTSCRQQIRSFVLGIIVWGVLVMFLKSFKKTEAFGNETTDQQFNDLFGSTGSDDKRIDNENELATANDLIAAINTSTGEAIGKIQNALEEYERARANAGSTINDKVTQHQNYAQGMITGLSDSLEDAARMIKDKRADLGVLQESVKTMADTGSKKWNQIIDLLNKDTQDTEEPVEGFRQPRRRRSGNVPKPSVAATSLGN